MKLKIKQVEEKILHYEQMEQLIRRKAINEQNKKLQSIYIKRCFQLIELAQFWQRILWQIKEGKLNEEWSETIKTINELQDQISNDPKVRKAFNRKIKKAKNRIRH